MLRSLFFRDFVRVLLIWVAFFVWVNPLKADDAKAPEASHQFFLDNPEDLTKRIHRHRFEFEHLSPEGSFGGTRFRWDVESLSAINKSHKGAMDPESTGFFVPVKLCVEPPSIDEELVDIDSLEVAFQKRGRRLRLRGRFEVQSLNQGGSRKLGTVAVEVLQTAHQGSDWDWS